jgi:serine/threonine protein phosphatase PrpC
VKERILSGVANRQLLERGFFGSMLNQGRHTVENGTDSTSDSEIVPAAISDTGCERELNEDRYAVVDCSSGVAWVVCDGMGGNTGGELAAQLAIDAMRRELTNQLEYRPPEIALKACIFEANRVIVLRRQNPAFAGMGTTVVAAMIAEHEVCVGHVGDSRAYLIRGDAIQQLTTDHTYVQELVERGQISEHEALDHPQAHILTRCLGSEPGIEVTFKKFYLWPTPPDENQDFMFLCSDGLYSLVTDQEIVRYVKTRSPQRACIDLVDLARERGGYDNITMAVVPLEGQLRNEAPQVIPRPTKKGKANSAKRAPAARERKRSTAGPSFIMTFMYIFLLSIIAASGSAAYFLWGVAR